MAITEVDEKLLVRAYQAGDERAFDTIVRTQWKALYAHAVRRLSDHDAAEDAVQDTLLRAYRALPKLDGDLALRAWLHRILTNVCYDEGNRRRRTMALQERVEAQPEEVAADAADEAVLHDTVRIMAEALKDLPDSYREALVLRYVDGLSFREVAEVAGVTEENARARVHRGKAMLHKIMSRVAVIAAFIVPGLKRTQTAPADPAAATAATSVEPSVSLVTQLTSHAMNAAPAVTQAATTASMLPSGKSALVTGAIAAAAAVSVPMAAYTVNEARQADRPPAAVAAPADLADEDDDQISTAAAASPASGTSGTVAPGGTSTTVQQATTTVVEPTTTTLPRSAAQPFAPIAGEQQAESSTTTTAPPTTTTTAPPSETPPATITRALLTDELTVVEAGSDFDLNGTLRVPDGRIAQVSGRLRLGDGSVRTDNLRLVVEGIEYVLRFRGPLLEETVGDDGARTYRFTGMFALADGFALDLPESGDVVSGTFSPSGAASLALDLEGPAPEES